MQINALRYTYEKPDRRISMRLLRWVALSVVMGVLAACTTSQANAPSATPLAATPTDAPLAKSTFIFLWRTG